MIIIIITRMTSSVAVAVAVFGWERKLSVAAPDAAGTGPVRTTTGPISVATKSSEPDPTARTLVVVIPISTTTAFPSAAGMAGIARCRTEPTAGTRSAAEARSTTTVPTIAATERPWRGHTALTPFAVAIRSTTTVPNSAAKRGSWRSLTAIIHIAVAIASSTAGTSPVVAIVPSTAGTTPAAMIAHPIADIWRCAATEKSGIASSGRTRAAAGLPCMITERVSAAMDTYIPGPVLPAGCSAVAATASSTQTRCAVIIA